MSKGSVVAAVEAMKARNDVTAPCDGTVTAIQSSSADFGVEVSFDVNEAFIGDVGSTITLTAPGVGGDSEGGPAIAVGDRLLISGDETYAWTCGFSRTWSAEMAAEWEAATR